MFELKNNQIRISVRNLVEFICNSGNIDSRLGGTRDAKAMQEGARLHRKLQGERQEDYRAEVSLKKTVSIRHKHAYEIVLEGRADGILIRSGEDAAVEEIKCIYTDIEKLKEPVPVHLAQAMCYAYIYGDAQGLESLEVIMTYCQIESEKTRVFSRRYSFEELQQWFDALMEKFCRWTDFLLEDYERRQASIGALEFPFAWRPGQKALAGGVYRAVESGEKLFIQAPTGTGKTISTLFPAVKAMGSDLAGKLFYLTAKTITRTVAQDTLALLREEGLCFRSVTVTARDKICPLEERKCNPVDCPYADGHYDRVNDGVYDIVTHEYAVTPDKITEYAQKHRLCPFEFSLDITYWCDGIICDYNYVFDPNVYLKRFFGQGTKGDYIFLVDEAHNLVERGRSMYSAQLVKEELMACARLVREKDKRLGRYLEKCNKCLLEYKRACDSWRILDSQAPLLAALESAFYRMQTFFEDHKSFEHMDKVSETYLKIRHYLNIAELADEKYVIYTGYDEDNRFFIRQFCADPSSNLAMCMDRGVCSVLFSATLLPVNYYKEMLTGNSQEKAVYARSVFPPDNKRILAAQDVTSRYRRRTLSEYGKMADYIVRYAGCREGNYLVFFPSFSYLSQVYACLEERHGEFLRRCEAFCQKPSMSEREKEEFLSHFTQCGTKQGWRLGFCVMGGVFSEGIDLKEDSLIGVAVVGTGLPQVCAEREILKGYFDAAQKDGYAYAYTYPGMNKVLQAAGRVIRTEEDRGVIMLLDDRFLSPEYTRLFPREWDGFYPCVLENVEEIVRDFWQNAKSKEKGSENAL